MGLGRWQLLCNLSMKSPFVEFAESTLRVNLAYRLCNGHDSTLDSFPERSMWHASSLKPVMLQSRIFKCP